MVYILHLVYFQYIVVPRIVQSRTLNPTVSNHRKIYQNQIKIKEVIRVEIKVYLLIRDRELEILKLQVDNIILPWVADGVPMYWKYTRCNI